MTSVGVAASVSSHGRLRRIGLVVVGPVVLFALVIIAWYIVSIVALPPQRSEYLLPQPHRIFLTAFADPKNLLILLDAFWVTIRISLIGLAISIAIGMVVAVIMVRWRSAEHGLYPWMVILQTIPTLALIPLISFWLGFGEAARIVVCVLISLFPIVSNTFFGLQSPSKPLYDLFTLHHASKLDTLLKLNIPLSLPAVFTGLRISAGLSVIGEIVGGFYFQRGSRDLGVLLIQYQYQLNGVMIFGAILMSCILGILVFLIFGKVSDWIVGRWT